MRSALSLVVAAALIGATVSARQRLLPAHRLHDVRLLPVRGGHERAGRLRRPEVAGPGRACSRPAPTRSPCSPRAPELDPWLALALAAVVSGACGVLIALPSLRVRGPVSGHGDAGLRDRRREARRRMDRGVRRRAGHVRHQAADLAAASRCLRLQWVWFGIVLCARDASAAAQPAATAASGARCCRCRRTRSPRRRSACGSIAPR